MLKISTSISVFKTKIETQVWYARMKNYNLLLSNLAEQITYFLLLKEQSCLQYMKRRRMKMDFCMLLTVERTHLDGSWLVCERLIAFICYTYILDFRIFVVVVVAVVVIVVAVVVIFFLLLFSLPLPFAVCSSSSRVLASDIMYSST